MLTIKNLEEIKKTWKNFEKRSGNPALSNQESNKRQKQLVTIKGTWGLH